MGKEILKGIFVSLIKLWPVKGKSNSCYSWRNTKYVNEAAGTPYLSVEDLSRRVLAQPYFNCGRAPIH